MVFSLECLIIEKMCSDVAVCVYVVNYSYRCFRL